MIKRCKNIRNYYIKLLFIFYPTSQPWIILILNVYLGCESFGSPIFRISHLLLFILQFIHFPILASAQVSCVEFGRNSCILAHSGSRLGCVRSQYDMWQILIFSLINAVLPIKGLLNLLFEKIPKRNIMNSKSC